MNNQSYTQDQILDAILGVACPNPKERQTIDRTKIKERFHDFYPYIEHCQKKPDFMDCMKDYELEFLELILELVEKGD